MDRAQLNETPGPRSHRCLDDPAGEIHFDRAARCFVEVHARVGRTVVNNLGIAHRVDERGLGVIDWQHRDPQRVDKAPVTAGSYDGANRVSCLFELIDEMTPEESARP